MLRQDFINICIDVAIELGFEDPEIAFWQCNRYSQAVCKVAELLNVKGIKLFSVDATWQIDSGDVKAGTTYGHVFLKVGSDYVDFTHRQIKDDTEFPFVFKKIPKYFKNLKRVEIEKLEHDDEYIMALLKK